MNLDQMVFVFGSNMRGIHGAGAAKFARDYRGAIRGQGVGRQGQSYALPTCHRPVHSDHDRFTLEEINDQVKVFLTYAKLSPNEVFQVTAVGCGIVGYTAEQIAPMFEGAPQNCMLPPEFRDALPALHSERFWSYE